MKKMEQIRKNTISHYNGYDVIDTVNDSNCEIFQNLISKTVTNNHNKNHKIKKREKTRKISHNGHDVIYTETNNNHSAQTTKSTTKSPPPTQTPPPWDNNNNNGYDVITVM